MQTRNENKYYSTLKADILLKPVLLKAYDRAGSTDPYPGNGLCGRKLIVFHNPTGNQCPGSTQTRLTMYGNGSVSIFTDFEKLSHNGIAWSTSVDEEEVPVIEAIVDESVGVVKLFIESYNCCHIMFAKVSEVRFGRMQCIAVLDHRLGVRTTKCYEFVGNYPIEVSVLHFLLITTTFTYMKSFI
jgi:hypothetical protein